MIIRLEKWAIFVFFRSEKWEKVAFFIQKSVILHTQSV